MISTISPAASYVEETLSTLRYAKQACLIINIAKVNEDVNAKLIRGKADISGIIFYLHAFLIYCLNRSYYQCLLVTIAYLREIHFNIVSN